MWRHGGRTSALLSTYRFKFLVGEKIRTTTRVKFRGHRNIKLRVDALLAKLLTKLSKMFVVLYLSKYSGDRLHDCPDETITPTITLPTNDPTASIRSAIPDVSGPLLLDEHVWIARGLHD